MEGFTRSIGISTSVDAELWAFRDGLMLYINLNLMAVEIEIDAKVIFDQVSKDYNNNHTMPLLLWIAGLSLIKFLKWGWITASGKQTNVQMWWLERDLVQVKTFCSLIVNLWTMYAFTLWQHWFVLW